MSKEKQLKSGEIIDKGRDLVNTLRHDGVLSNAEIVMVLHTAHTMQLQQIVIDTLEKGHDDPC